MNMLQSTFEKHKKLMLERLLPEADLTKEQNYALKFLYVTFRNIAKDLVDQAKEYNLTEENVSAMFSQFYIHKYKIKATIPTGVKIKKILGLKLEVNFPESIRNVLPRLADPVTIVFNPRIDDGDDYYAQFNHYQDKQFELVLVVPYMLRDFDAYKAEIQHEMQHVVDSSEEGETEETQPNKLLRTMSYQLQQGELAAHAKAYAYKYFKKFPNDDQLDFDKFKKEYYKNKDTKLNNYINFGEDSERLRTQYNLTPEQYNKMIEGYKTFVGLLKRSLLYFKEKFD